MSTLMQLEKDREQLNNLIDDVSFSASNYRITIEALKLAQKYMDKCENLRKELKQKESEE